MQIPHDFPPVPKCFSHLLNAHSFYDTENDGEDQTLSQSLPSRQIMQELNRCNFARSLSENSHHHSSQTDYITEIPTSTTLTGGGNAFYQYQDVFIEDSQSRDIAMQSQQKLKAALVHSPNFMSPCSQRRIIMKQSSFDFEDDPVDEKDMPLNQGQDLNNPFVKLNSSLEKLQKEMKELRLFDVSLFYQLLSLHESIQDLKLNINDRYSETGSECSLGSASYMGSMSSLDEESDWGESQIFMQSFRGEESAPDDDENRQSTSSLLEQITALTQKAEEDI